MNLRNGIFVIIFSILTLHDSHSISINCTVHLKTILHERNPLLWVPIPYHPIRRTFTDKDKRFNVFVERPLVNVLTSGLISFMGQGLKSFHDHVPNTFYVVISNTIQDTFASLGTTTFWSEAFGVYVAYQLTSLVRDGVSIEKMHWFKKTLINYFYTGAVYSIVFAKKDLLNLKSFLIDPLAMNAPEAMEAARGLSVVAFSYIWAAGTQLINSNILGPFLFNYFLKASELDVIFPTSYKQFWIKIRNLPKSIKKSFSFEIASLDSQDRLFELITKSKTVDLTKDEERERLWLKWFILGLDKGDPFPFATYIKSSKDRPPLTLTKYWSLKTSIASVFAILIGGSYLFTKDYVLGTKDNPEGPLYDNSLKLLENFEQNKAIEINQKKLEEHARIMIPKIIELIFSEDFIDGLLDREK